MLSAPAKEATYDTDLVLIITVDLDYDFALDKKDLQITQGFQIILCNCRQQVNQRDRAKA
jgi:hypothetical protein